MCDPLVENLIKSLKDPDLPTRWFAAKALGDSDDISVVPALVEALKDENYSIRINAAESLRKIGSVSSVPALITAMKDNHYWVRSHAASALGKIGDISAFPALLDALRDRDSYVRMYAGRALGNMGSIVTLQRKILVFSGFSTQMKIEVLDALTLGRYKNYSSSKLGAFFDTQTLCKTVLNEEDIEARAGAQNILNWLNGGQYLLRPSQCDDETEAQELLRAVELASPETHPATLLRAYDEPGKER